MPSSLHTGATHLLQENTYVFIDGNYLRKVADSFMQAMFGVDAELDFDRIRPGANVRRVFYYDCLNDRRGENESVEDFEVRLAKQETMFNSIQSLRGFHVRLGSVTGNRRKLRQKKVDVLLVVDALEHAFRGNMSHFCLLAGDLDFAPLVDCLVRLGTYVNVMYEPKSAAVDLYRAADSSVEINFNIIHNWSTKDFKSRYPVPQGHIGPSFPPDYKFVKLGTNHGKEVKLHKSTRDYLLSVEKYDSNGFTLFVHGTDLAFLEKYFQLVYGQLTWKPEDV